jgi:sensor c-di-GMP phosphodiesterase-like protein
MSPAEFIPLAEKEGMIERITDYVVEEVFNDLGHFLAAIRICIFRLTCRPRISTLRA